MGKPLKSLEGGNNNLDPTPEKKLKTTGNLGNSPLINEESNKKDRKLFYSTTNFPEESHSKEKGQLQTDLEMLRLNEKELKNELKQKTEENEGLKKELAEKTESEKHLRADVEEMHAALENVQTYFQTHEKKIERIGNVANDFFLFFNNFNGF